MPLSKKYFEYFEKAILKTKGNENGNNNDEK